jgi:hypothetical protein
VGSEQAAVCEHHFISHVYRGMSIRLCQFCHQPDWNDLEEQFGPSVTTQNTRGQWVPSIPLPFFGVRKHCGSCKKRFWTEGGYRGHYALEHILHMKP